MTLLNTLVLLNGPPRCGKDTIAMSVYTALRKHNLTAYKRKISKPLKDATHAAYGCHVRHDHFEHCKEEPNEIFFGLTPRQAYINMSELLLKPSHGDDIVGKMFIRSTKVEEDHYMIISDCGFLSELEPIIEHYATVFLVRLHREGTNFDNDSRSYVYTGNNRVFEYDVDNNGSVEDTTDTILNHLEKLK